MKTIRKNIILVLLSLNLIPALSAQETQPLNSLLWKLEGNDLKGPSYLYATIHLICPDDFLLTEATRDAISASDQLVMELDMDDPSLMTKMQQLMINDGMKNFSESLSGEQLKTLNAFFTKHYGSDLSQLGVMKPFALVSMMMIKSIDCEQPASYEGEFMKIAKENQLEIYGLETPEFQMGIFDKIALEEQISWLMDYASDEAVMKEEFETLIKAYKREDLDKLYLEMIKSSQFEGMEDALLFSRNKAWIDKIVAYAAEKSTFFAVGAGHLASEKGVIQLLRDKGYKVTPAN